MKLKIELIIFDLDGVIINSGADIASSVNYTLKYFGKAELPEKEIISYVGHGSEKLIRTCFKGEEEELIKAALYVYIGYYLEHCVEKTKLYNNLEETLNFFKYKKMAIVTSKPEKIATKILKELGISDYFYLIIGPESVEELKPNPQGLLKVLKILKEIPENAIMIGDSYSDVEVGKTACVHTCGVTYGLGDKSKLIMSSPDFLIDDIGKLKEFIK
jgi:phosphoglycolate phosphatase